MQTFLFTDIADSSRLWQQYPREMSRALADHDHILKRVIQRYKGRIVKSTGDGVHAAFERISDACWAAIAIQQELSGHPWEETGPLRVRMGLHTGEAERRDGDYFGTSVNKAARLMALAAGGQVLLTEISFGLLKDIGAEGLKGRLIGKYRLKGLAGRTGIYQLTHPDLPGEFPALPGGESVPNNLPLELTSFIGREREIDQIIQSMLDTEGNPERRRLVTLIGPGGTGKTRLSIQAARQLREAFMDGVWLVELAPLTDPVAIPQTVLDVLALQETPDTPAIKLLSTYLRERQALLIFDNCEHLVEASAQVIEQILQAAPLVQVLASSREALGIYGETVQRIPSLPLPRGQNETWEQLQSSEAVQLFLARAEAANAQRWLTADSGPAIAQICRRLDGIPLAIEMAAARLRVFSPAQILDRLDDRFRLLTGGSRTALPRLQTLQALIDWSYDLLSEEERGLLRDLSVFADGWTIEMAAAVCADWDVDTLLPSLVDKSLVVAEPQEDGMRYKFLETIRQYARDRLMASGRGAQIRHRHLRYFVTFTYAEDVLDLRTIEEFAARTIPNIENFRAALTWGLEEDPLSALELAGNLMTYWSLGPIVEGLAWVDKSLEIVEGNLETDLENVADRRLRKALANGYLARNLSLFQLGHNEKAYQAAKTSLTLYQGLEGENRLAMIYGMVGLAGISQGIKEGSLEALEKGIELAKSRSNKLLYATLLNIKGLARIYLEMDIPGAVDYMEQAIAIEPTIATWSISGNFALIKIQALTQNWARARELVDLAIQNTAELIYIENKRQLNMYYSERGHIERQSGNLEAALNIYARMILSYRELSMEPAVANLLECFAMIAVQKGQLPRAGRLFGAAEALRERIGADMTSYERMEYEAAVGQLKTLLDPEDLDASWQGGRNMSMDQAIDFSRAYADVPRGR